MQSFLFVQFMLSYIIKPKFSHRFVGYIEEEAIQTYTRMLERIATDGSELAHWRTTKAKPECAAYYQLPEDATLKDIVACIRADEICHGIINHHLASADPHIELPEDEVKVINDPAPGKTNYEGGREGVGSLMK